MNHSRFTIRSLWFFLFIGTYLSMPLLAQEPSEIDTLYRGNFLPTPSLTFAPETGFRFGAFALWQFKVPQASFDTRSSYVNFWVAFSERGQQFYDVRHLIYTRNEKFYIDGTMNFKAFNENFYGLGTHTLAANEYLVSYHMFEVKQRVLKQWQNKIFIGPQYRFIRTFNLEWSQDTVVYKAPGFLTGSNGSNESGLGFSTMWDKRNSVLTPTENFYLEGNALVYSKYLGGDHHFAQVRLDGRKYWNFNTDGKQVLAVQGVLDLLIGDVPFKEYGKIGGNLINRGYLEGRFRDRLALQTQVEYRVNLIKRFGMVGFAGIGQVSDGIQFQLNSFKYTGGLGLRYNLNRKDTANIRLDFGFADDGTEGFYIGFGEAF